MISTALRGSGGPLEIQTNTGQFLYNYRDEFLFVEKQGHGKSHANITTLGCSAVWPAEDGRANRENFLLVTSLILNVLDGSGILQIDL